MKTTTRVFLSVMMFLEYFIWGAWYVTMGTYMSENLQSSGVQIGAAYSALAIATMISPFFVGIDCGPLFCCAKNNGVFHLLGGVSIVCRYDDTDNTIFYW